MKRLTEEEIRRLYQQWLESDGDEGPHDTEDVSVQERWELEARDRKLK